LFGEPSTVTYGLIGTGVRRHRDVLAGRRARGQEHDAGPGDQGAHQRLVEHVLGAHRDHGAAAAGMLVGIDTGAGEGAPVAQLRGHTPRADRARAHHDQRRSAHDAAARRAGS